MTITKTLGGDRLGSGNKMKLQLHNYERSTHDMSYLWRSTMSPGTIVPFLNEVALPGDTFDIKLDCDIKTHPTIGPLFGSFKVQLDVFLTPIRIFHRELSYDKIGIGNNMKNIFLPVLTLRSPITTAAMLTGDIDNTQINPSCILSYLGYRGIGYSLAARNRNFNGIPLLNYWQIYRDYYANKQENIGAVIHNTDATLSTTTTAISRTNNAGSNTSIPKAGNGTIVMDFGSYFILTKTAGQTQNTNHIMFNTSEGSYTLSQLGIPVGDVTTTTLARYNYTWPLYGNIVIYSWDFIKEGDVIASAPKVTTFPLQNIDLSRESIITSQTIGAPFYMDNLTTPPYSYITDKTQPFNNYAFNQEGLALKTYQSDLFNNWLSKTTFDNITALSAVSTTGNQFTIDSLNLAKKVHNLLNRIMVSGGSYEDWLDAVYAHDRYTRINSPVYQGGLIKELVFQEVVANATTVGSDGSTPLGQLGGKGVMSQKHKGGYINIKVDEPSYIMGVISLTPRLDYSQGNKWDIHLQTMDDFHKPGMDQIGFQDLITEQMAWWSTEHNGTAWIQKSAGKQPAWINYMTNVNQTRGNFAVPVVQGSTGGEMFMTLNRKYEPNYSVPGSLSIKDLTTYIDPVKYNQIFAKSSIDAQNFWVQIAVDIEARRKISAKQMPNP